MTLNQLLQDLIEKSQVWAHLNYVNNLIRRVNAQISLLIPDHYTVEVLSTLVSFHLEPEPWWYEVELCFGYRVDLDDSSRVSDAHNQCQGPVQTCKSVNSYTEFYSDYTDDRRGACLMHWVLTAPGTVPDWFNDVRVCFQFWPDDDASQCGDGSKDTDEKTEFCEAVNTVLQEYRDNTNRRYGGCKMQWKIEVPEESPSWMLNVKICFNWEVTAGGDA